MSNGVLFLLSLSVHSQSSNSKTCSSSRTYTTSSSLPLSQPPSQLLMYLQSLPLHSFKVLNSPNTFKTLTIKQTTMMGDGPSTSGFLCHTCVWRERSESHELMDIEALMRHGKRYHYLQQSQMGDYCALALPTIPPPPPPPPPPRSPALSSSARLSITPLEIEGDTLI